MKTLNYNIIVFITISLSIVSGESSNNLTCYQCIRKANMECEPHELQPCPPVSDRCVTHIAKNAENGFSIKRECGLGPCGFDDDMINRGLGFGKCDRSREEYFCIFCCKESGCNKSKAVYRTPSSTLLLLLMVVCTFCWKNKCITW